MFFNKWRCNQSEVCAECKWYPLVTVWPTEMCRRSRKPFSFCFSSFFTCRRRLLPLFFSPSASHAAATTVFVGDDSAFDFCLPPHTALCFRTNYHNNSFSFPSKPKWTTTQSITKQQNTPTPRKTTGQARPSHARHTADTF